MWKVILFCSLCLGLSGYCFAKYEYITTPAICQPEERINANLIPSGSNINSGNIANSCISGGAIYSSNLDAYPFDHAMYRGINSNGMSVFECYYKNGQNFFSGGMVLLGAETRYSCPTGYTLDGTQCVKPKSCTCPNDKDWVLANPAPPVERYCYRDDPESRNEYCQLLAEEGDSRFGVTQGGCYPVAGLPTSQGCFYVYSDDVLDLGKSGGGTSVIEKGPGIKNTGVLCTVGEEDPKDKPKEPQSPEDCREGQTFHANAVNGKNVCTNPDGTNDNGKSEGSGTGEGGNASGGKGEASGGKGEASGNTGESGESGDSGSCPSWAKGICDAFNWGGDGKDKPGDLSGLPDHGNSSNQSTGGESFSTGDKFMGGATCPAPKVVNFSLGGATQTLTFSYDMFCQFAQLIRYILITIAVIVAGRIVFGSKT